MDAGALGRVVKLDFSGSVQKGHIEDFNGRNGTTSWTAKCSSAWRNGREKLKRWRRDYKQQHPHTALDEGTPEELARALGGRPFALSIIGETAPAPCQDFAAWDGLINVSVT
jgi:hypothetical protein